MPKFALYESAIHHFLLQVKRTAEVERHFYPTSYPQWEKFILSLRFEKVEGQTVRVTWTYPKIGRDTFSIKKVAYYVRGDTKDFVRVQKKKGLVFHDDSIKEENNRLFFSFFSRISKKAGFTIHPINRPDVYYDGRSMKRYYDEESLSDDWAQQVQVGDIDVFKMNESCTAPEMRYITSLVSLKGKSLLDIGCGLGEASVYFALKGARVTVMDISVFMIDTALALARVNHVTIKTQQSSIEHFKLPKHELFDIIYVGNLFHHVDIDKALERIKTYLKPNGILVSWEPVDYNPIINIYRKIATQVRSKDERPIRIKDLDTFKKKFRHVETKWFWLTTLVIFIIMAVVQRRDPNKERYWKAVVKEGDQWSWLYTPLEALDKGLLAVFPFLRYLCWNVVIIASSPKQKRH
jgi:2-polyprenyl-3-methyl-5-hydroxy-6-metoxy-1,4-benzoquinol methylase